MEFSENHYPFNQLIDTPFSNLLDDEIPQDIFEEIMNDINSNGGMMEVNSMSSEDSGRSSISYDDNRLTSNTTPDQMITNMNEEQMIEMLNDTSSSGSDLMPRLEVVEIVQPSIAGELTTSCARTQQHPLLIAHPKIVVRTEPIAFQPPSNNLHSFVTLQSIDGQLYTTMPNGNQAAIVQSIGNGSG